MVYAVFSPLSMADPSIPLTCSTQPFLKFFAGTFLAPVFLAANGVPVGSQLYYHTTFGTKSWFKGGRVLKFHEIEFVGSIIDIHFSFKRLFAFETLLPNAFMFFDIMKAAQGVATMISAATVRVIREWDVFMLIIANPLSATFRSYQILRFPA